MQYLTHDNLQLREGDEQAIEVISLGWKIPSNAESRSINEYRIGDHRFRENLAARSWIIVVDEFADAPVYPPELAMANTRITCCIRAITMLRGVDNEYAREVVASAKAELDDYNKLVQNS